MSSTLIGLAVGTVFLGYKERLTRSRGARAWVLRSVILFFTMAQVFSVPGCARWIGQFTGVPNLARLLTYSSACACAAAFLTLILMWRYPEGTARTKVRWVLAIHGVVICTLAVLFALSSVPEERPTDFPTYYGATQPTVAALMTLFVVTAMASFATLAYWCFTLADEDAFHGLPWLRLALRLFAAVGLTFGAWLAFTLALTIAANWFDRQALGPLYNTGGKFFPVVAVVLLLGALVVPVWGPRWSAMRRWIAQWRSFLVLRPLHRVLHTVAPAKVLVTRNKRLDPHHRVRRMVIELNDWRTTLSPLFNPEVRQVAEERARLEGLTGERLEALVEAAQLRVASGDWSRGIRPPGTANPHDEENMRDGSDSIDAEIAWWTRVAHAYRRHTPLPDRKPTSRTPAD